MTRREVEVLKSFLSGVETALAVFIVLCFIVLAIANAF